MDKNKELEIIKDFFIKMKERCSLFHTTGCARDNFCGMAELCGRNFSFTEKEIEDMYKIYDRHKNDCMEELKLAKIICQSGIDCEKLKHLIEAIKN